MSWQDELNEILRKKGVMYERSEQQSFATSEFFAAFAGQNNPPPVVEPESTLSFWQHSRRFANVSYGVNLVGVSPELHVCIAVPTGYYKMELYRVQLQPNSSLAFLFAAILNLPGSMLYRELGELVASQFLNAIVEPMKALFWKGDLDAMEFPAEIVVERWL